jgi:transcriptional regulator with PAS, ATPase and Fis domain
LIGHSPAFLKCVQLAKKAATSDANILITGESGTGKELIAHAIHHASKRSGKPFIAINCAAIPKELLASELFGYVGGAFTGANPKGSKGKFQLADGGTLFLDEVGDMPMDLQVQLLRAIQEQEIMPVGGHEPIPIDVRIIAATNKNLEHEIREGRFREDLYYRIKVFEIELPALRERPEDIPLLSRHFLDKFAAQKGCGPYELSEEALECLQNYHWPGNIRQLRNAMEYAVTMAEGERITPDELPAEMRRLEYSVRSIRSPAASLSPVEQAEARWIRDVLAKHRFDLGAAARELNMNRSSIYRKIKKYGMDIRELKKSLV